MSIDARYITFPQVSDLEGVRLAFDLGFYPTRLFPLILAKGNVVYSLTWLECLDGVSGTDVYERAAELNSAHYGCILESWAGEGKRGEQ